MFDDLDNPLIYPKHSDITLPTDCVVRPIISPTQPLDFILPDNVCSTLSSTYTTFTEGMQRVQMPELKSICQTSVYRTRNYDVNFAKYLSDALAPYLPAQLVFNENSRVDWESDNPEKYNVWNLIGISPFFQYFQYNTGSQYTPHYITPYNSEDDPLVRTLYSGYIYLDSFDTGATAFVDDEQQKIPYKERDHSEWKRQAKYENIYEWFLPKRGNIIIFPHGECHAILPNYTGEPSKIVRFDIYYSAYTKR